MEIHNLSEYVDKISKLNEECSKKLCLQELLFRGHSDIRYKLLPSIARGRNTSCDITIFNGERNLIELAKNRFPDVFREEMNPVELLALLQHYGIPTRLLDVTENALVALYFSCCSNLETDGEVFVFVNSDDNIANAPVVNAIAETYKLTRGAPYSLDHFYSAAMNQPYFLEQKHIFEICKDNINGAEWIEKCCSRVIFAYAPFCTLRQQFQLCRFILFPNKIVYNHYGKDKMAFDTIIEEISKDNECILQRYIIKKQSKKTILRDLKICGISESTLFCDNIDSVCKGIVDKVRGML